MIEVAVVGGGPAGLAVAIGLALRGVEVVVFERGTGAIDKACGEGVMPAGLAHLEALGVLDHLDASRTCAIRGIRYVNENGARASARLPSAGLGIRRIALSRALRARARESGVELREGCEARWSGYDQGRRPQLRTSAGLVTAGFVVAADGLHSRVREAVGLSSPGKAAMRRFGMRRHVRVTPWSDHVEVHFSGQAEAYVTPVGANEVGIALLWDARRTRLDEDFGACLARFEELAKRVAGRVPSSEVRGAGPMLRRPRAVVAHNVALVGDAAGYVDAITGEGISLALATGAVLVDELASARRGRIDVYAEAHHRAFRDYARLARALLWTARRPRLRSTIIDVLAWRPALFAWLLQGTLTAANPSRATLGTLCRTTRS